VGSHSRHAATRGGPRLLPTLVTIVLLLAISGFATVRVRDRDTTSQRIGDPTSLTANAAASASQAASAAARSAAEASSSSAAASASAAAAAAAAKRSAEVAALTTLTAGDSASAVSVAAVDTTTGASYEWGADDGMLTGSIVKLYIIETLLLQEQGSGGLTSDQQATATKMIENSDNTAAETLFEDAGGRSALVAAGPQLGLKDTVPGPSDYWGLTATCATDYITLLQNLVRPTGSPLTTASQAYVLGLMRNVEADQRWGVGVTADAGTDFANKNGWLSVDNDNGRWLVNSTGVLTIDGQQVLMVVLTQHDSDFQSGINLVQSLAKALVPLVVSDTP
jgi:Beta-lactamase enzyme family